MIVGESGVGGHVDICEKSTTHFSCMYSVHVTGAILVFFHLGHVDIAYFLADNIELCQKYFCIAVLPVLKNYFLLVLCMC